MPTDEPAAQETVSEHLVTGPTDDQLSVLPLERVLEELHPQGLSYACTLLERREADAHDAVQEASLALVKAWNSGPMPNPKAYFMATIRNLCALHYRKRHSRREVGPEALTARPDPHGNPIEVAEQADEQARLLAAIQQLPDHHRFVVTQKDLKGQEYRTIAKALAVTVDRARGIHMDAIRRLRCLLSD
jgi:RNA polymerase sigma factor (sigma-70 family)